MVCACYAKRGALRSKEGYGNGSSPKYNGGGGWTVVEKILKSEKTLMGSNCTTKLHGGVYRHISTPYKSGTKGVSKVNNF